MGVPGETPFATGLAAKGCRLPGRLGDPSRSNTGNRQKKELLNIDL